MAVREPLMVYHGTGSSEYQITPNFNEGIVIKEIYVPESVNDWLLLYIGKTLVGFYSLGGCVLGNNLFVNAESRTEQNLYNYLVHAGIFRPYLVAEGETITFRTANGSQFEILVIYETLDAADIDPAHPGGSKSEEYDFIHYIKPSNVDVEATLDMSITPSEFPAFPANASVPAGKQIVVYGVIGIPTFGQDDAANPAHKTRTKAIKFIYNRKVLFDEQKIGLTFEGVSTGSATKVYSAYLTPVSACSHIDKREPFLFPQPLIFDEGETLEVKIVLEQLAGSTIQLTPDDLVIGLIETVRPVG